MKTEATGDFETYSEAGMEWDGAAWRAPRGSSKKGLSAVGVAAYAEHPTTEILCFQYRLPGWPAGFTQLWLPGMLPPVALFDWLAAGCLIEFHNAMFERAIWHHVAGPRYGWPPLPTTQIRCSMARAHVNNLPGGLSDLSAVLELPVRKDADGRRLLTKFSMPRKPTKGNAALRILPAEDPEDAARLYQYCATDVLAEGAASDAMAPMSADELRFWQLDQEMNWRGLALDVPAIHDMIAVLEQAQLKYGREYYDLTGGLAPTQVAETLAWLGARGVRLAALDADAVEEALASPDLPAECRRALEIRGLVASASVKKLYSMARAVSRDGRVRNIIVHHGARTGRPTGDLVQPLNLPKAGPDLQWCDTCDQPSRFPPTPACPWCGSPWGALRKHKWPGAPRRLEGALPADAVIAMMRTRNLETIERFFGSALSAISGCVRSLIVAGPGRELIASDYSAIEAVVTAVLSGCRWRIEAFERREDIYLVSAGKVTGRTLAEYQAYREEFGDHHPDRQKIGKPGELGLGFGGWVTAWRQFDSSDTFTDDEVKRNILAWRAASPEIPEMWGGQARGKPWMRDYRLERFGFEGAFVNAVQFPGQEFWSHGIRFMVRGGALFIRLLSGRELTYHSPNLWPKNDAPGEYDITYMTWNTNPKYGPRGWVPMKTYGGRIAENVVQATAHDIQRYGIEALEAAGYPVVLHVYDENVAEVPEGFGSLEEFERIMGTMPPWAHGWPVRASGGWRGKRYRKA